jgi:hypothetical protein
MYNISMLNRFLVLLILLSILMPCAYSQEIEVAEIKSEVEELGDDSFEQIKLDRLKRMRKEIVQIESQIYMNKKKVLTEPDMVLKLKLESENSKLLKEYNAKRILFIETLTGLSIFRSKDMNSEEKSFSDNLSDIFRPVLSGIKSISERPRQIQMLEESIKVYKEELNNVELAIDKIKEFRTDKDYKQFSRVMKKSLKKLELLEKDYKIKLEDAQFQLIKLEKNKGSFVGVFSQVIFDFLKTKGKNLLLSISAFILIIWFFSRVKNKVISFFVQRLIRFYGTNEASFWFVRPVKVIYSVSGFFLALFVALIILYIMNDWVLVTFILFTLGALVWSSKEYFPIFFEQSKVVLNVGAIRENEIVIFQSIPWKVKTLGYYCRLENPLLTGGTLRISSRELLTSHSRPIQANEPWFPTKTNDWVILDDGMYGKVTFQSPEQILIKLIGGAIKYMKTDEFLKSDPVNISTGFGIEQVIGVDYSHQKIVLDEVIPNIKETIIGSLKDYLLDEYEGGVYEVQVDFKTTGASSLDIRFFVICSGTLAPKKLIIERKIQAAFVEVCNTHGYIIPFSQMTVHMAPNGKPKKLEEDERDS